VTRSRTPLVIAIVLVVAAGVAIAAVLATRGGDDEDSASTVPPPAAGTGSVPGDGETTVTVEGAALPPLEDPADDAAVGSPAPALRGTDYQGNAVDIVPGTGGPMMVVFLAHWCPHCNNEIPVLLEWRDSGQIPADLQVFGVSTAADEARPNYPPDEWLAERGWDWPVLADDAELTAALAYGVTGFPFFTIVDADGNVAARGSGEYPIEALQALVDSVA
jgi:thiol-disulfide isomerase/thioredoxin